MSHLNFQSMSLKELRNYVLQHRNDDEAFYMYIDRKQAEGTAIQYPPLQSVEDLKKYPEVIAKFNRANAS